MVLAATRSTNGAGLCDLLLISPERLSNPRCNCSDRQELDTDQHGFDGYTQIHPEKSARIRPIRGNPRPISKTMANSTMQSRNVQGTLALSTSVPAAPVLLVDDIADSRWTLTLAGWLLRTQGSGIVYPFVLARATARKA